MLKMTGNMGFTASAIILLAVSNCGESLNGPSHVLLPTVRSQVLNVTGTAVHGGTLVITGTDFGTKSPAAPLIWDDGESSTVDSPADVLTKGWVDPWPSQGSIVSHMIQYRSAPYRSTPAAHSRSTRYLAGGHYQEPDNNPPYIGTGSEDYRNVMVTADAGSGMPRWFATFYYRIDPLWITPCEPNWNHKTSTIQSGGAGYTPAGGFSYTNYRNTYPPCSGEPRFNWHGIGNGPDGGTWPDDFPVTDNPLNQWVRYEERIADDDVLGFRDTYINNEAACRFQANYPNWFSGQGGQNSSGIRSYTVGGYFRWATDIDDDSTYRGGIDNFRYFDDIYVDSSLARVMLADNSDFENAVITEPQIPSSWSNTSITIEVNLGRLPSSGTVYLFVFNNDNLQNTEGYAVAL